MKRIVVYTRSRSPRRPPNRLEVWQFVVAVLSLVATVVGILW